mgnify:CR=1 FL=1|jgi:Predicted PP-loop superfamily ATPase
MKTLDLSQNYQKFFDEFHFHTDTHSRLLAIDIVNVMSSVYYADISINKVVPRRIDLEIPVYFVDKWDSSKCLIHTLLHWVSEEYYTITFIENKLEEQTNSAILDDNDRIDTVTLFSGGLDSFAGAFHNLQSGIHSDYIGFVNKSEEKTKQKQIRDFYHTVFPDSSVHLINRHDIKKAVYTQSTRSLLYMSLAIAKSLTHEKYKRVYIYENGVLSLNPELKGRYTTKTTHPYTIYLFNELLNRLGIDVKIENPFIFKTKAQILQGLSQDFKNQIVNTFTCGQSRINPDRNHKGQCGVCIPCLLRKISLAANEMELFDVTYQYPYEIRLKDIAEADYRKDYVSNLEYFSEYVELIRSQSIFSHLQIRKEYYNDEFALQKTKQMLETFADEFERFMMRYAPY